MIQEKPIRSAAMRSVNEDDIAELRRTLQMPAFDYVDFSAMRERDEALARWPLLRELHAGESRRPVAVAVPEDNAA